MVGSSQRIDIRHGSSTFRSASARPIASPCPVHTSALRAPARAAACMSVTVSPTMMHP